MDIRDVCCLHRVLFCYCSIPLLQTLNTFALSISIKISIANVGGQQSGELFQHRAAAAETATRKETVRGKQEAASRMIPQRQTEEAPPPLSSGFLCGQIDGSVCSKPCSVCSDSDWSILPFTKEIQHSETDSTVVIREGEDDEEEHL